MEVRHGFPTIGAIVDDQAVAGFVNSQLGGHFGGLEEQMTEQAMIFGGRFREAGHNFFGDDQDMSWRLGIDVAEGEGEVVLEHNCGRDFARDDFLENCHGQCTTSEQDALAASDCQT